MINIFKISFVLFLFQVSQVLSFNYPTYSEICGNQARRIYTDEELKKDQYISKKLQQIFNDENICKKIYIYSYDISNNYNNYIVSFLMKNNSVKYVIQDNNIIYQYNDNKHNNLIIGTKLSIDGNHNMYSIVMTEGNTELEQGDYKNILGYYFDGIIVQSDNYKKGYIKFLKKNKLEYYFGINKISGNYNYNISDKLQLDIFNRLNHYSNTEKDKLLKIVDNIIKKHQTNNIISYKTYKKRIILDFIYSQLKIEQLKRNNLN